MLRLSLLPHTARIACTSRQHESPWQVIANNLVNTPQLDLVAGGTLHAAPR